MSETNTGWRLLLLDAPAPSLAVESNPITLELVSPGPQGPSGAAVTSVNGETGAVVLDASDVGAAATSHTHGVGDVTGLGTAATRNAPAAGNAGAAEVVLGSDSRLSDTRTPTDGSVTSAKIASQAVTYAKIQNVTANRLLGRTIGSGSVEELQVTFPLAIDSATGALKLNNNATDNNAVMFYSSGNFSTSNRFGWNNATATLKISDTAGADASSFTNTGISTVLGGAFFVDINGGILTLGDISNNETRIVIDDASSDISFFANTLSASSTAATFAALTLLGPLTLQNGEFLSNSANGVMEFGPNGTTSGDFSLVVDGTTFGSGLKLYGRRRSDGNTAQSVWWNSPLMMGNGVEFALGTSKWYTISYQESGKGCMAIGLLSGAQVSGSTGSMVLCTNNEKGQSNRVPATSHTHPTLYQYSFSNGAGFSNDYLRSWHEQTRGVIESGRGDLDLMTPAGSSVKANGSTLATQAFAIIQAVALS